MLLLLLKFVGNHDYDTNRSGRVLVISLDSDLLSPIPVPISARKADIRTKANAQPFHDRFGLVIDIQNGPVFDWLQMVYEKNANVDAVDDDECIS